MQTDIFSVVHGFAAMRANANKHDDQTVMYAMPLCVCAVAIHMVIIITDNIFLFDQPIQRGQMQRGRESFRLACGHHHSTVFDDKLFYGIFTHGASFSHS